MPQLLRREIVDEAHRKLGVVHGANVDPEWSRRAVRMLNTIMAEENERMAGQEQPFYTQATTFLTLEANQTSYDVGRATYLPSAVEDLTGAWYNGGDAAEARPLKLVTAEQWGGIADKDKVGEPECVYHQRHRRSGNAYVHVWPIPEITPGNVVISTNGNRRMCVESHVASASTRPDTGFSSAQYWISVLSDSPYRTPASSWEESASYKAHPAVKLTYRRALESADADNVFVDMPPGWDRYVTYRLAFDLSAHFAISIEERQWLKAEYLEARELLFPSTVTGTNDHHNKTAFF